LPTSKPLSRRDHRCQQADQAARWNHPYQPANRPAAKHPRPNHKQHQRPTAKTPLPSPTGKPPSRQDYPYQPASQTVGGTTPCQLPSRLAGGTTHATGTSLKPAEPPTPQAKPRSPVELPSPTGTPHPAPSHTPPPDPKPRNQSKSRRPISPAQAPSAEAGPGSACPRASTPREGHRRGG
jgi:hypothetical protein